MIRSDKEDLVMVRLAEVSKEVLRLTLLLAGSGSAVSEVRVTLFERDPSVEGSTVPVQDMAAETSSVVGRIWISCIRGETHSIRERS